MIYETRFYREREKHHAHADICARAHALKYITEEKGRYGEWEKEKEELQSEREDKK